MKPTNKQIEYALHLVEVGGVDYKYTREELEAMNQKEISWVIKDLEAQEAANHLLDEYASF